MGKNSRFSTIAVFIAALVSIATAASAQFNGHNSLGDFGMLSGTQPDPGLYATAFYYRYDIDSIRGRSGNALTLDPERSGDITLNAIAPFFWYVSDFKLAGANVGTAAAFPFVNATLEAPVLGVEEQRSGAAFGDVWIQPLNLGWHTPRADVMTGFSFYAPTGKYEPLGDDNAGLGMWSFELFAGTTIFFDEAKSWSFATNAYWETHTEKKDTEIKVGDVLTLEGGFGKSFAGGAISVGAAYFAHWKITEDEIGGLFGILDPSDIGSNLLEKHRVFGLGPDVTIPIATSSTLFALVNVKYLWEFGARSKSEGRTLVLTATFPVPSLKLQ